MDWPSASEGMRLILECLIKSTAVLSAALLFSVLLRRRAASLRHFVLSFFFIGLLFLPALFSFRFGWETGLLPGPVAEIADHRHPEAPRAVEPLTAETDLRGDPQGSAGAKNYIILSRPSSGSPLIEASRIAVLLIWMAGLMLLLMRVVVGLCGAYRLTKEGEFIRDPAWKTLLNRLLASLKLRRPVRLKCHDDIGVPLTWGVVRPVVLVPAEFEQWTEGQRSSALLHELSHIKRADFLVMILVRLSLAVFWFNPLAWIVFGMMKKEQEKACDELVLRTGLKPSTYAANLLLFKSAARSRWNLSTALLGILGRSSFNERLAAILKQKMTLKEVRMKTKIMLGVVTMLAVAIIGMARPEVAPSEPSKAQALGGVMIRGDGERFAPAENPAVQADEPIHEKKAHEADAQRDTEQEKEKAKQEEEQKKEPKMLTIVIKTKKGEKSPIELSIIEGDEAKTIEAGKSITIKKVEGGEFLITTSEGKELKVLKGEPLRLKVEKGNLELVEEGGALKIIHEGRVLKVGKEDAEPNVFILEEEGVKPNIEFIEEAEAEPHIAWTAKSNQEDLRKKVEELRAKLEKVKAKELDISELEKTLEELDAELKEQDEAVKAIALNLGKTPGVIKVIRKKDDGKTVRSIWISEDPKAHTVTIQTGDKGKFSMVFGAGSGELSREAFDRIVDRVKKELPEGYGIESEFEEESGLITLKFSGPKETKGAPVDLVKRLTAIIKDELKKG